MCILKQENVKIQKFQKMVSSVLMLNKVALILWLWLLEDMIWINVVKYLNHAFVVQNELSS